MLKTIIIDDEKISRNRLKRLLENYNDIDIISEADNGKTAVNLIDDLKPDLIFLDIQMPEFTGFDVLQHIQHFPVVIFVTAYDDYALQAFEVNSLDYIVKPVEDDRLKRAITKAKIHAKKTEQELSYFNLIEYLNKKELEQFSVRIGDKVIFIPVPEISYIEAKEKTVFLNLINGKQYSVDSTITSLEDKLCISFVRIHRAFLINKNRIKEAERLGNGKYNFIMMDSRMSVIKSSIGYSDNVKKLFQL